MSALTDLADELKSLAKVDVGEGITDADLQGYVTFALRQHDKYVTPDTLPIEEQEPVLTLAWAKVCLVRASKLSMDANLSGAGGFGRDANTPYNKCMALSKELITRYGQLCGMLRVDKQRVVTGTIFIRDNIYDAMLPLMQSVTAPNLLFAVSGIPLITDTSIVVRWGISDVTDYYQLNVFQITGDTPIFQDWNYQSGTGVPKIADGATKLLMTLDNTQTALKITDLDRNVTNRFLLALRSRSNKYCYSAELVLESSQNPVPNPTPPAPVQQVATVRYWGSDANGHVIGSPGDLCVLLPSREIQVKDTGIQTNTGWI